MMRPYVGEHYSDTGFPSLLLIGESHYVPEDSEHDIAPEAWYLGNSGTLSDDELLYISTAQIINKSRVDGFSNPAHSIYRNAFLEINEFGPAYADFTRVADHIAFYNFFLRPAFTGDSLIVTAKDIDIANEAFRAHYEALKPTAVIFFSTLARSYFHPTEPVSIPVIATPHPGCPWWNRTAKKYGDKRGRDILADFIKATSWPKVTDSK